MWNGSVMLGQTNVASFPWTQYQYTVTAPSTQATLRFEFRNDDYAFGLDDVEVEMAPDSGLRLKIVPVSAGSLVIAWNGEAGTVYQLQSLDSLAGGTWVNLGVPLVGVGGELGQGVETLAGLQTFYRVITTP
jgi:hypothetical protein